MNSIFKYTFILFLIVWGVVLQGCAVTPVPVITVENKTVVAKTPDYLLVTEPIPIPPAKDAYISATAEQKEGLLVGCISDLQKALSNANIRFNLIKKYQLKLIDIYETKVE